MANPDTSDRPSVPSTDDPRDDPQPEAGIVGGALLPMLISVVVLSTISVFIAAIAIN